MTTNITTDIDNTNTQAWMKEIWDWADTNNNPESKIPREADALLRLRELDILFGGYSTHVPDGKGGFREIDSRDPIAALPEAIKNLKSLRYLRLNGGSQLPKGFEELDGLRELVFLRTSMEEIPEAVCKLKNLKELYIMSRSLKKLPDNIGELSSLRVFDMRGTQVKQLPKSFTHLTQLSSLTLCVNPLEYLPEDFDNLSNLEYINKVLPNV